MKAIANFSMGGEVRSDSTSSESSSISELSVSSAGSPIVGMDMQFEDEDAFDNFLDALWEATCPTKRIRIQRGPTPEFRFACLSMLINVMNSCDYKLLRSFMQTYGSPEFTLKTEFKDTDYKNVHNAHPPRSLVVRGYERFVHIWAATTYYCPDTLLTVSNFTISTRCSRATKSTLCLVKCMMKISYTQLYTRPGMLLATAVLQELYRQIHLLRAHEPSIVIDEDALRDHILGSSVPPAIAPMRVEILQPLAMHVDGDGLIRSIEMGDLEFKVLQLK